MVTAGLPRGAGEAPVGGSAETVMNLTMSDTLRYELINEDTVRVNGVSNLSNILKTVYYWHSSQMRSRFPIGCSLVWLHPFVLFLARIGSRFSRPLQYILMNKYKIFSQSTPLRTRLSAVINF